MSKIKEIASRLEKDPRQYIEIRLLVAKRTLWFFLAFFYLTTLFTIGGFEFGPFSLQVLSQISFHAYTVLVLVLAWFFYEFIVYTINVYLPEKRWVILIALLVGGFYSLFALYAHLI